MPKINQGWEAVNPFREGLWALIHHNPHLLAATWLIHYLIFVVYWTILSM